MLFQTFSNLVKDLLLSVRQGFILILVNQNCTGNLQQRIKARQFGVFKTLWVIHSGEIYGKVGRLLVDAVGLIVILISIAGHRIKNANKFSLKWHNRLGSWAILILMITTITGMFLRPPLLIPIANAKVAKIKYSELDNPNPWFDRLRDLLYDKELNRFVLATSEGIYYSNDAFGSPLRKYPVQPPVSVMGITVLEVHTGRIFEFIIGKFYILIVPLTGLVMLLILVTGFFAWWIPYRRIKTTSQLPTDNTPKSASCPTLTILEIIIFDTNNSLYEKNSISPRAYVNHGDHLL